jgi:hypothetical protein
VIGEIWVGPKLEYINFSDSRKPLVDQLSPDVLVVVLRHLLPVASEPITFPTNLFVLKVLLNNRVHLLLLGVLKVAY